LNWPDGLLWLPLIDQLWLSILVGLPVPWLFFLGLPGFSFLIFLWLSLAGLLKLSLSGLLWLTTTLIGELYGLERLLSLMAIPISKAGLRSRLLLKINFY
jgi:hypothetical protein